MTCTFRVAGKAPELWDPVTGERRFAAAYTEARRPHERAAGVRALRLVVRRLPRTGGEPSGDAPNATTFRPAPIARELTGALDGDVRSQLGRAGVGAVRQRSSSWTDRPEPGIKFYSGTATYAQDLRPAGHCRTRLRSPQSWLDLGDVRELAEVRLNGKPCGIVWAPPFRVDITEAVEAGRQRLEVEVVNFWPNRIIGDAALAAGETPHEDQHPQADQGHPADGVRPVRAGAVSRRGRDAPESASRVTARQRPNINNPARSRVEPELDDVAVLDDVVLALDAEFAGLAGLGVGAGGNEVVEGDHLGGDEAALEIGVDHPGGRRALGAGGDRPGARLLVVGGEEGAQPSR